MVNNTTVAAHDAAALADSFARLNQSMSHLSSVSKNESLRLDTLTIETTYATEADGTAGAMRRLADAISFTQTQDAYLQIASQKLDRMSVLSAAAQDASKSDAERASYDEEFRQAADYVVSLATKEFNGASLFSGESQALTSSIGAKLGETAAVDLTSSNYAGLKSGVSLKTAEGAADADSAIANAVAQVRSDRQNVGDTLKELTQTSETLATQLSAGAGSKDVITNADEADQALNFIQQNMIMQTGRAMLSLASSSPAALQALFK